MLVTRSFLFLGKSRMHELAIVEATEKESAAIIWIESGILGISTMSSAASIKTYWAGRQIYSITLIFFPQAIILRIVDAVKRPLKTKKSMYSTDMFPLYRLLNIIVESVSVFFGLFPSVIENLKPFFYTILAVFSPLRKNFMPERHV